MQEPPAEEPDLDPIKPAQEPMRDPMPPPDRMGVPDELRAYVRDADPFRDHAGAGLL
jgi:hypothetical protein